MTALAGRTPTSTPLRRPRAVPSIFPGSMMWLAAPGILLLVVFVIYPFARGAVLSFTNWDGFSTSYSFNGIANYLRLFSDPSFLRALGNTFLYGVASTVIQQLLGLGFALLLQSGSKAKNTARAVLYLPALLSPVVVGTLYYLLFQYNNGALNEVALLFGGTRQTWLNDATLSIVIIILVNSLQFFGISMVIYIAGLQGVPTELLEASRLDGASTWQSFVHVVLPLLQPAFATSLTLNLIGGFKIYDAIVVLTNGGPGFATNSVSTLISRTYFENQSAGYASAMGIVLFVLIGIITVVLNRALRRREIEA